ncbi:cytosolic sulfotransferase 3-like [Conger conger]|uniref:cytosolic sulfotransferase 3-like n=1 Tax=Conger conger TaxID=82655 RepID=UPI002A59FA20|nr:cytosolic sulfotransferase 3-like [Conger conger]
MANQDQKETVPVPRPELFEFHGVSMIHYFTDNWDNVQNFQAKPDDILIATYPKSGTTWVSHMLDLLYFGKSSPKRRVSLPIYERAPFLEFCFPNIPKGVELAEKMTTSPCLIRTHLPVQFVPKSFWEQKCRVVYVARNAKDNVVSYFHFDRMNSAHPEPGDWPRYLQRFQEGKSLKKRAQDIDRELDRVCSFLGVCPTEEERHQVKEGVEFDTMKKNRMANQSTVDVFDFKISPFMRKGKVGDWKNHFTVYQNEQFDKEYKKKMMSTTLWFRNEI